MAETTCDAHEILIQSYLDGELSVEEGEGLASHLAVCTACREVHDELVVLGERLREMYPEQERAGMLVDVVIPDPKEARQPTPTPTAIDSAIGAVGRRMGGYEIKRQIAKGGMGRVYEAVQLSMDRPVALKVLSPEMAENEQFAARFVQEARLAATVSHPNIVSIYDVGQDGEQLYYSMELVTGEDMEEVLDRDGRVPQREAARIGLEVAQALVAAGAQGIIHRDIKPANILRTSDGAVKVADLGLAKALENQSEDASLTVKKMVIGSPNYMSPEQAKDIRTATKRSDIYSLGSTLLHFVTGEKPFGGGSAVEILARVLKDPLTIPDVVGGEALDPQLKLIIARAMEKDPADRFADAEELVDVLQGFLAGREVVMANGSASATSGRKSRRVVRRSGRRGRTSGSSTSAKTIENGSGRLPKQSVPTWLWGAAAALVLGILGLAIVGGGSPSDGDVIEVTEAPPEAPSAPPSRLERVVSDETGESAVAVKRDETTAEGELRLAALQDWVKENPHLLGEQYRRSGTFLERYSEGVAAKGAQKIRKRAEKALEDELKDVSTRAKDLQLRGRLWDAKEQYASYLADYGEGVPGEAKARLEMKSLSTEIAAKKRSDLRQVDRLVAAGRIDDAKALLFEMAQYAGLQAEQDALNQYAEAFARAGSAPQPPAPQPPQPPARDGSGDLADKGGDDGKGDDGVSLAEKAKPEVQALAMLSRARQAVASGNVKEAEELLEKLSKDYGDLEVVKRQLTPLAKEIASASAGGKRPKDGQDERGPDTGKLLASVLNADVELLEGDQVSITYAFSDDEEAWDWLNDGAPGNWGQRYLYNYLMKQPPPAKKMPEAWATTKGGVMLAYGFERRRFMASLDGTKPIEVTLETKKSRENLLIGFKGSGRRTTLAGMGYLVPKVNLATLFPRGRGRGGGGWGGDERREYFRDMERTVRESQGRGPSIAVVQENGLYQHEELFAKKLPVKGKNIKFSVTLQEGEETDQEIVINAGKGRKQVREATPLEKAFKDEVHLYLVNLGSVVAYDKITIKGVLSKKFRKILRQAAKQAGDDPKKLREIVRERAKGEEKREGDGDGDRDRDRERDGGDRDNGDRDNGDRGNDRGDRGDRRGRNRR